MSPGLHVGGVVEVCWKTFGLFSASLVLNSLRAKLEIIALVDHLHANDQSTRRLCQVVYAPVIAVILLPLA